MLLKANPAGRTVRRVRRAERDPRRLLRAGPHHPPVHAGRPSRLPRGGRQLDLRRLLPGMRGRLALAVHPDQRRAVRELHARARSRSRSSTSPVRWRSMTSRRTVGKFRRPDGDSPNDKYRVYEVAGMGHGLSQSSTVCAAGQQPSQFKAQYVSNNALDKLDPVGRQGHRAAARDAAHHRRLPSGPLVTDAFGNALGGVRSYQVDVPVATYNTGAEPVHLAGAASRRRRSRRCIRNQGQLHLAGEPQSSTTWPGTAGSSTRTPRLPRTRPKTWPRPCRDSFQDLDRWRRASSSGCNAARERMDRRHGMPDIIRDRQLTADTGQFSCTDTRD